MDKKILKKLMTDLAKGIITQEQANNLIKQKKVATRHVKTPNNTHFKTKSLGGKK